MMAKLLIVDDEARVTDTLRAALAGKPLDVLVANSTDEAIALAREHRPEYATIDFSIDDRDGNQVASELRAIVPGIVMAGLTGGDPQAYDAELFAIRESKMNAANEQQYPVLVQALQAANPREAYHGRQMDGEMAEQLVSLYILVQGYNLGMRIHDGEQPVEGVELPAPPIERIRALLEPDEGLDVKGMLQQFARVAPVKDDERLRRFYDAVSDGRIADLDLDVTQRVEQVLQDRLEAMYDGH